MIDTSQYLSGYDAGRDANGYYFDPARAAHAIDWIEEHCTHVKGSLGGDPLYLEPWQQALVGTLFGWYSKETHLRRYREVLLYIPRKNGKTPLASAIGLYVMDNDGEPGFEAISAAGTADQASLIYDWICGMIRNDEHLASRYRIYKTPKYIVPNFDQSSRYKVLSADAGSKHGGNVNLALFDELHTQPDRELFDVIATSTAARRQPLFISLTTADTLRERSICNEKLAYAKAVIAGTIEDATFLPAIFAAKPKANWRSLKVWKKANPNYGVSLQPEYVKKEIAKCEVTPSLIPNLKRFHLNIQTGAADNWLRMEDWKACPAECEFEGPVFGGLDLAQTDDITAFVLYWPETSAIQCKFYLPEETASLPSRRHYQPWIESGALTITEGSVTDYMQVREDIVRANDEWQLAALGYDPYNANEIATALYNDHGVPTVNVGFTMRNVSEASKKIEAQVRRRKLQHGHNPVMNWMAGNCCVRTDFGGNIQPSKKYSAGKIDGIAALVTAQAVAINQPDLKSVYEERGMISI